MASRRRVDKTKEVEALGKLMEQRELARKLPPAQALAMGMKAGAASVRRPGGRLKGARRP
jgi:hypothetical protein